MAINELKNRTRLGVAIKTELLVKLQELSARTEVPQSKLVDRALDKFLSEYERLEKQG